MSSASTMQQAVQRYLDDRRRLGFALDAPATELMRFARYADARAHAGPLTQELMLGWAREHVCRTSAVTAARRLEIVRPFAAHFRQFEPTTEIPPKGILGRAHRRLAPHIYAPAEIAALLDAAAQLALTWRLRPATYRALFGLIAAVGLRVSEALKLTLGDVDLQAGTLTVRQTKFHKSRCLPLHQSTVRELSLYRQARDQCHDHDPAAPFFVSHDGKHLPQSTVQHVFRCLQTQLGWQARGDHARPRIHDLRHTFAVRRLLSWRQTGQSIEHAMFWLCTYLGHAKISDTYWYLSGVPELMDVISARFEHFTGLGAQEVVR